MKKKIFIVITVSFWVLGFVLSAHAQEDMERVDNSVFDNPRRPPAVFPHDEHNELAQIEECSVCHHVYDKNDRLVEDESSEDQSCADCHSENGSDDRPRLIKAFHLNCKGCHQSAKKGPIMCGECHVR